MTYLGSKVEAQVAATREVVLDEQRYLVGQADLDLGGQGSGLAKVDKVLEGEGQGHGLSKLNIDIHLRLLNVGVAAESDGTVTNVTVGGELDAVLGGLDADCGRD